MKRLLITGMILMSLPVVAQQPLADSVINEEAAREILGYLASDQLKGRGNGRPERYEAADYLAQQFQQAGLKPLYGQKSFLIPFFPQTITEDGPIPIPQADIVLWNGDFLQTDHFEFFLTDAAAYADKSLSSFEVKELDSLDSGLLRRYAASPGGDLLLWTKKPVSDKSNLPEGWMLPPNGLQRNVLIVVNDSAPKTMVVQADPDYYQTLLFNVVGVLPGDSLPGEIVAYTSHYDHMGVDPRERRDSILNGANDNASGTTAVVLLARYFSQLKNNSRTLLFCAFAGEEWGLLGSREFMKEINPKAVVAGINIEMIGIAQYGKKKVFITGQDQSPLGKTLARSLSAAGLRVIRERDPERQLYSRSDNYSFVKAGAPAHTIMSSDDEDRCYHQPCDEVKRINFEHLVAVVRAIAAIGEFKIKK